MSINLSLPVSDLFLKKLQQLTANDNVLKCVSRHILNGWPERIAKVDKLAKPSWAFCEELSFVNDVMLKGEKISVSLKQEVLQKIHACRLGTVKCTQKAKDVMLWCGMSADIYDCISLCSICHSCTGPQRETFPGGTKVDTGPPNLIGPP